MGRPRSGVRQTLVASTIGVWRKDFQHISNSASVHVSWTEISADSIVQAEWLLCRHGGVLLRWGKLQLTARSCLETFEEEVSKLLEQIQTFVFQRRIRIKVGFGVLWLASFRRIF